MVFDPKKYLIKVQGGKQYLPVSARLIWFREAHPDWGIETKLLTLDIERQYAVFEATVFNSDGKLMAKGTKMEDVRGFPDYVEKAETGAIGRALAVCGFGTQFAPELDELANERYVDSPQPQSNGDRGSYEQSRYGGRGGNGDGYRNRDRGGERPRDSGLSSRPAANASATPTPVPEKAEGPAVETPRGETAGDDRQRNGQSRVAQSEAGHDSSCSACGRELTHSQAVFSLGKFGIALCPTCQKERRAADV